MIVLFSLFLFLCCCCFNTKNLTLIVSGCLSASDYFFVVFPLNLHHISTHIHIVSSTAQLDRYIYTSIYVQIHNIQYRREKPKNLKQINTCVNAL